MKKIIPGLLVVAAGTGVYFLMQSIKSPAKQPNQTEMLSGHWTLDSFLIHPRDSGAALALGIAAFLDSEFTSYRYDVMEEGRIRIVKDAALVDSAFFEIQPGDTIAVKGYKEDSKADLFHFSLLKPDSLELTTRDSTRFVFVRTK